MFIDDVHNDTLRSRKIESVEQPANARTVQQQIQRLNSAHSMMHTTKM